MEQFSIMRQCRLDPLIIITFRIKARNTNRKTINRSHKSKWGIFPSHFQQKLYAVKATRKSTRADEDVLNKVIWSGSLVKRYKYHDNVWHGLLLLMLPFLTMTSAGLGLNSGHTERREEGPGATLEVQTTTELIISAGFHPPTPQSH